MSLHRTARLGMAAVFVALAGCGAEAAPGTVPIAVITIQPSSSPGTSVPAPKTSRSCFEEPVRFTVKTKPIAADPAAAVPGCATDPTLPLCRFAVARAYFDANRFERAAPMFIAIALDGDSGDVAPVAAEFALDAMHMMATKAEPQRPECWEEVDRVLPKLRDAVCGAQRHASAESACSAIQRYAIHLRVGRVSALSLVDDAGQPMSSEHCESVGDEFWAIAAEYCLSGTVPEVPRCDHMLYNAYRSYQAANLPAKAARARAELLDPKNGLHTSELAQAIALEP